MPRKPMSFSRAPKLKPGRALGDADRADALRAWRVAEPAVDEVVVRVAAVGDPALAAVDDVLVAVEARLGAHVGRGRAGVRLGDADGHGDLAADRLGQDVLLLLLGAEELDDAARADVGLEHLERGGTALLGQLLLDDERVEQGAAVAAVLLRERPCRGSRAWPAAGPRRPAAGCGLGPTRRPSAHTPRGPPRPRARAADTCSGVSSKPLKGSPVRERVCMVRLSMITIVIDYGTSQVSDPRHPDPRRRR